MRDVGQFDPEVAMDMALEVDSRLKVLLDKQLCTNVNRTELVEFVTGRDVGPVGGPPGFATLAEFRAHEVQQQEDARRVSMSGEPFVSTSNGGQIQGGRRKRKAHPAFLHNTDEEGRQAESRERSTGELLHAAPKLGRHMQELEASLLRDTASIRGISHLSKGVREPCRPRINSELLDMLQGVTPEERARMRAEDATSHQRSVAEVFATRVPQVLDLDTYIRTIRQEPPPGLEAEGDGEGEVTNAGVHPVSDEEIRRTKLTAAEIKGLPGGKFADYSAGLPSQTLYIKNLAKAVEEADLRSLFERFRKAGEDSSLHYRLMQRGRMRGQAFVRFIDAATAQSALELVNGYLLKGQPMVIAFGREG